MNTKISLITGGNFPENSGIKIEHDVSGRTNLPYLRALVAKKDLSPDEAVAGALKLKRRVVVYANGPDEANRQHPLDPLGFAAKIAAKLGAQSSTETFIVCADGETKTLLVAVGYALAAPGRNGVLVAFGGQVLPWSYLTRKAGGEIVEGSAGEIYRGGD